MLISILIPVYNVSEYVAKCINSVIEQTYKELEVIIVDDCGTDDSMNIVENIVSSYNGPIAFRIIHHDKNYGLSIARNTGINAAKGKYLYFLDSDDWIVPECIELMVNSLAQHKDSQIVFAGAEVSRKEYKWLDYTRKDLPLYSDDRDWIQLNMLKRFVFGMTTWNKLILRDMVLKHNLYFQKGMIHQDEIWNYLVAKYVERVSFVRKNTYIYNINDKGISMTETFELGWTRRLQVWEYILNNINGYSVMTQARGLCSYILNYRSWRFVRSKRISVKLFWLLLRAGLKMDFPYNLYTICQSFFCLINFDNSFSNKFKRRIVI